MSGKPGMWPFGDLQPGACGIILADPPTEFRTHSAAGQGKSASRHYAVESIDDICRMFQVGELADPAGCILILWSTWALVAEGSHVKMLDAWGFRPSSGGSWAKVTTNALPCFGTGYVLRDACEPFITGIKGRVPAGWRKTERNLILAERREHSRKPDAMHQMIERAMPNARRCELFARAQRPGWEVWGDEVGRFAAPVPALVSGWGMRLAQGGVG